MMMAFPKGEFGFSPFGEVRTAERTTVVELKSIYGVSGLRDTYTETASGTLTNTNGEYKLTTTASGTDAVVFDSAERGRYLAGEGAEAGMGLRIADTPTGNQAVEWGLFDDDNGFGFGYDATGFYVFDVDGGTQTKVRPASFTNDALDGTGPSGETINLSTGYIFQIDFAWYGFGTIEYKLFMFDATTRKQKEVLIHRLRKEQQVSIQNPNLPLRVTLKNNGTANAFDSVYVGGRQFSTVGSFNPIRRVTTQYRLSLGSVGTTFLPTVSFRRKSAFLSVSCKSEGFDIITDGDLIAQLRTGGSLTNASWVTPSDHTAAETALEADISATAITGGNPIWAELVDSAGTGSGTSGIANAANILHQDMVGTDPFTLCVRRISGTGATVSVVFRVTEEW